VSNLPKPVQYGGDDEPRIAVLGGGPIGLACALLLARRGLPSRVIEARTLASAQADRRLLALSRGSLQVLAPLFGTRPPPMAAIEGVHVSSAGEFGTTQLTAADSDGAALGATVYYGELLAALDAAARAEAAVDLRRGRRVAGVTQHPDHVTVHLDRGGTSSSEASAAPDTFDAAIAVHAEGASAADEAGGRPTDWALIAAVELEGPPPGAAFERFTREGPLALLPAPPAGWSLVWCAGQAEVQRRIALADAAFGAELQAAIGPRLARVRGTGARGMYPLSARVRSQLHAHRTVWLGNAAQTLHPVAGQGFNLGLRDCAALADALAHSPEDLPGALADYARRRRADRALISVITHWLPDIFATRAAPMALARMLGLTALNVTPPLRRALATVLMFGVRA
jgi:2-octaprenyl-6-methoxyphenol hydroxylase